MRTLQRISASSFSHHSHNHAYGAVVLSGGYEEAGDQGRFHVSAGDVVLHERFEAHVDRFPSSGAVVFNLYIPAAIWFAPGLARIADPDSIARVADKDPGDALNLLLSATRARVRTFTDWPDLLAARLIENPTLCLHSWSEANCLKPWTVSRGFARIFGISPEAFRARARARQAWRMIQTSSCPLAQIACDVGFADQSHMSRSVKRLSGLSPCAWRRDTANRFKTEAASSL